MRHAFDVEHFLASLPFRPVVAHGNLLAGYIPPAWRHPQLIPYNGFTGEQRIRTWQIGTWLRKHSLLSLAPRCDLCLGSSRLGRHSENYADIERALTICSGCHLSLHKRFRQPEAWRRKVKELEHAPEWALALSTTPFDMKDWLLT